jgi:alcohol dehydrogenase class IV
VTVLEFSAPTRVVAGLGSRARTGEELRRLGAGPVAVVCDAGVARAGLLSSVVEAVDLELVECGLVDPDPDIEAAEAVVRVAREAGCRGVLTVGGGSAIVVGKVVAIRLANDGRIDEYEGIGNVPERRAPCVAVPTTAGSGSEVSNALVLHDPAREQHVVVRGRGLEPDTAILDGELLVGLPRAPFLDASLDALSHALEALWARGASPFTDALALAAARQIRETLARALELRKAEDLQLLLEASTMANLACGSSYLGLVHALSSSPAVHIAHGRQNSVLLPHVAAFNVPVVDEETRAEIAALDVLYASLGVRAQWNTGELDSSGAENMVRAALVNPFRLNNRREAGERELRAILAATGIPEIEIRAGGSRP